MSKSTTPTHKLFTAPFSFIITIITGHLVSDEHYVLAIFFFMVGLFMIISAIRSKFILSDLFDFKQHYIWLLFTLMSSFYISFGEPSISSLNFDFIMALGSLVIGSLVYASNKY